jgi:hypothetical protein
LIQDHTEWIKENTNLASTKSPCVFGDLERCIPTSTFEQTDDFWTKFMKVDRAPMYNTQHCFAHNRQCQLFKCSDFEVAGLPCPDYSVAGLGLMENGRTVGAFLTHAKRHVAYATPLLLIENVKDWFEGCLFRHNQTPKLKWNQLYHQEATFFMEFNT